MIAVEQVVCPKGARIALTIRAIRAMLQEQIVIRAIICGEPDLCTTGLASDNCKRQSRGE